MSDTSPEVTREEISAIAYKLAPAFDSLTESERKVFAHVMDQIGAEHAEVSGFSQQLSLGTETLQGMSFSPSSASRGEKWRLSWFANCCQHRSAGPACCPTWGSSGDAGA